MTTDLVLAIDQGTTGSTALLVDANMRVLAAANTEFAQHFPRPGWVEHDPEELWASVLEAIAAVVAQTPGSVGKIAAIGITNQRETTLVWDRESGAAIHRAIVWQDRRTAAACQTLKDAGHEPRVRELTGLVLDPYFSGTKLAWLLDSVDGARAAATRGTLAAGTVDTYILWRLSGGQAHATEPTNASRTLLWPLRGGAWSEELCGLLNVPHSLLPEVHPCTAEFGHTRDVPGLRDGIPIHGIAGDQQAALFGQACFEVGQAKCTYGTGAFVVLNTGSTIVPSEHGLLTSVAWQVGDATTYCLEGSAFTAGALVQWLRDALGMITKAAEIEDLARSVPDSAGVVLVPALAGLGAPHWRPSARGLICGLTRGTTRGHLARAALEGIALQITDLLDAMAADLGRPVDLLKVDGGGSANDLLMQMQANFAGMRLQRPTVREATALGAVSLAGLGVGLWSDTEALRRAWHHEKTFEPGGDTAYTAALKTAWKRAVANA